MTTLFYTQHLQKDTIIKTILRIIYRIPFFIQTHIQKIDALQPSIIDAIKSYKATSAKKVTISVLYRNTMQQQFLCDWEGFYGCMFNDLKRTTFNFSETFFKHIQTLVREMYAQRFTLGHFIAEAENDLFRTNEKTEEMKKMRELYGSIVMAMAQVLRVVDLPEGDIDHEKYRARDAVCQKRDVRKKELCAKLINDGLTPNDARCAADVVAMRDACIDSQVTYEKFCCTFYGIYDEPPLYGKCAHMPTDDDDIILEKLDPASDAFKSRLMMLRKLRALRDIATDMEKARFAKEERERETLQLQRQLQLQLRSQEEFMRSYRTR